MIRWNAEGRPFACIRCGHQASADVNAACVILLRGDSSTQSLEHALGGLQDVA